MVVWELGQDGVTAIMRLSQGTNTHPWRRYSSRRVLPQHHRAHLKGASVSAGWFQPDACRMILSTFCSWLRCGSQWCSLYDQVISQPGRICQEGGRTSVSIRVLFQFGPKQCYSKTVSLCALPNRWPLGLWFRADTSCSANSQMSPSGNTTTSPCRRKGAFSSRLFNSFNARGHPQVSSSHLRTLRVSREHTVAKPRCAMLTCVAGLPSVGVSAGLTSEDRIVCTRCALFKIAWLPGAGGWA